MSEQWIDQCENMALYHVFLIYRDAEEEHAMVQSNLPSDEVVRLIAPLRANRPPLFPGPRIDPATITQLRIFRSEQPYEMIRLPFDQTPVDRQPDYVFYYFDRDLISGVESCTDDFFTSTFHPPQSTASQPVPVRVDVENRGFSYFLMCSYALVGNLVITVLMRWAQTSLTQSTIPPISLWAYIASSAAFIGLFSPKRIIPTLDERGRILTAMNASVLFAVLLFNLEVYFTAHPFNAELVIISYLVPYTVMIGQVVVITCSLFYQLDRLLHRVRELVSSPLIAAVVLVVGIILAYYGPSSTQYKLVITGVFGYLCLGLFLWIFALPRGERALPL